MSAFCALRLSRPILPSLYSPTLISRTPKFALAHAGLNGQLSQRRSFWLDDRDPLSRESNPSFTSSSSSTLQNSIATPNNKRPRVRNRKKRRSTYPPPSYDPPLPDHDPPENMMDILRVATSLLADAAAAHHASSLATKSPQITAAEAWAEGSAKVQERLALKPLPNAFSGRSVPITRSGSEAFAQGFRKLQGILRANNVYQTVRAQKRHEKKGVKRRRLASQTHRRKFAQLIRGKVALVQKYRARGS
ncbi:hypothetical protein FRB94_008970 [Tulasnella sp. JGI-2019a]|nr:hypothetical protein FRB93_003499 [Tulasnella sp. JGI-2019a]KAG9014812.1 hypothetical protein FRB94_008970 [Tulasnella sp. JGI-2019a]KAG9040026.1 hypothetical protein FRB95_004498 [Tulasnella sp. JGI-2019a]